MNNFSVNKTGILRKIFALAIALFALFALFACKREVDYFSYVSELRSNILLASADGFNLRVYATDKEYPYAMDGIVREHTPRVEIRLTAPSGDKEYTVSFTVDGKSYGGDVSYDNVKAEYYYSATLDISTLKELPVKIGCGETVVEMTAVSVLAEDTITPKAALGKLVEAEKPLFESMTDKYGFTGEIYLRLLYEDSPYYYVGVIDREGKATAFLLNAKTGKILAKRQP